MSTLLGYLEANGMTNERIESLLLSKFFLNMYTCRKNGEKYELGTISSFQRTLKRYFTQKQYPFKILKKNSFEKS